MRASPYEIIIIAGRYVSSTDCSPVCVTTVSGIMFVIVGKLSGGYTAGLYTRRTPHYMFHDVGRGMVPVFATQMLAIGVNLCDLQPLPCWGSGWTASSPRRPCVPPTDGGRVGLRVPTRSLGCGALRWHVALSGGVPNT